MATAAVTTLVVHSTTDEPVMCVVPAVHNIFCAHRPNATATGVEELIFCTAGFPLARLLRTIHVCSAGNNSGVYENFILSACTAL